MVRASALKRIPLACGICTLAAAAIIASGSMAGAADREGLPQEANVKMEIQSPVEVGGAVITLGEIATLSVASEDDTKSLAGIEVGKAPLPGRARTLSLATIRVRLRQAGFDPDNMSIQSPATIVVKTRSCVVTWDEISRAVEAHIRACMPWDFADVEVDVSVGQERVLVPDGEVSFGVELLPTTRFVGTSSVRVSLMVDGQVFKTFPVRARVDVVRGVVVAARTIQRHDVIEPSDVGVVARDLAEMPSDVAFDLAQAVGMRARHTIPAGRPVTLSSLEPLPLVRRGDPVTIEAVLGGVIATIPGEALEDGADGVLVRVRNTSSGAILRAKVVGAHAVRAI